MDNTPERMCWKHETTTAILVDGGFYRRRAFYYWGDKEPKERADELFNYCIGLLKDKREHRNLYRIFYYDCPPIQKMVYNPISKKTVDLGDTPDYKWTNDFFEELKHKRKIALRLGRLSDNSIHYNLKYDSFKKLINGTLTVEQLDHSDIELNIEQKGVDMRIGIDISSIALKKLADQIILISGDSDFVPAAKHARREGLDFILAPMGATIKPDLLEHVDGIINRPTKIVKTATPAG